MNMCNKSVIEKSILDIKLSKRSFICDHNRNHNTDSGNFDNRTESVSVVKIRNLSITFGNKTRLETLDRFIRQIFNTKHPSRILIKCIGTFMDSTLRTNFLAFSTTLFTPLPYFAIALLPFSPIL